MLTYVETRKIAKQLWDRRFNPQGKNKAWGNFYKHISNVLKIECFYDIDDFKRYWVVKRSSLNAKLRKRNQTGQGVQEPLSPFEDRLKNLLDQIGGIAHGHVVSIIN